MNMLRKVVSGGQTGVDRAALDAALASGVAVGGWCPEGRRAEDGKIPARYPLQETPLPHYEQRTDWNVRDSDATLILVGVGQEPTGGTALTVEAARRYNRPHLLVDPGTSVERVHAWITRHGVGTINIAGPRESEEPGIYEAAFEVLTSLFKKYAASANEGDVSGG